jgi:hypothetical protein
VGVRKAHNDLAGFTLSVIGVLSAVLLAFIAIATWESFSKASEIVEYESDIAGGIYLDTQDLSQAEGQPIRDAVASYVSVVINEEWPIQRAGKMPHQGWKPLHEINIAIATIEPKASVKRRSRPSCLGLGTSSTKCEAAAFPRSEDIFRV